MPGKHSSRSWTVLRAQLGNLDGGPYKFLWFTYIYTDVEIHQRSHSRVPEGKASAMHATPMTPHHASAPPCHAPPIPPCRDAPVHASGQGHSLFAGREVEAPGGLCLGFMEGTWLAMCALRQRRRNADAGKAMSVLSP